MFAIDRVTPHRKMPAIMWTPARIESRSTTLDLSASDQGLRKVRQVLCDGVVVCNAVDAIDWADLPVQWELCEACLCPGCVPGGRVALRRTDSHVLILPDFTAMSQSDWALIEHAPPGWMASQGALSFSQADWKTFRTACDGAPYLDDIAPASTAELLRLYHFQAPRAFLPDCLSPTLARWELILCTNGHDSAADLVHLKRLFSDPSAFDGHDFCLPALESHTVSAFLDVLSIEEWPLFSSEPEPAIRLSDEIHFRLRT